ncbi:hypothetical protein [Streptomyces sp. NPDC002187]|uniref:hypothetical protein n=1 Tax=Streptomyces sp. NPDC002187 TaxID=3364637 RepID=UPI0036C7F406
MLVDEVAEGFEVAACGLGVRVFLEFAPGGEQDEFGVPGAGSFLEFTAGSTTQQGAQGGVGQLIGQATTTGPGCGR